MAPDLLTDLAAGQNLLRITAPKPLPAGARIAIEAGAVLKSTKKKVLKTLHTPLRSAIVNRSGALKAVNHRMPETLLNEITEGGVLKPLSARARTLTPKALALLQPISSNGATSPAALSASDQQDAVTLGRKALQHLLSSPAHSPSIAKQATPVRLQRSGTKRKLDNELLHALNSGVALTGTTRNVLNTPLRTALKSGTTVLKKSRSRMAPPLQQAIATGVELKKRTRVTMATPLQQAICNGAVLKEVAGGPRQHTPSLRSQLGSERLGARVARQAAFNRDYRLMTGVKATRSTLAPPSLKDAIRKGSTMRAVPRLRS